MPLIPAKLYVVATPIGNPGDLSPRAREILAKADLVLAEDTRRAAWLCRDLGIGRRDFTSFHEHNEQQRQEEVIARLRSGASVALLSDAGTPLLADPGYRLVRACRRQGLPVVPLPGPCAPIAALSAAGLPPIPFTFLGFLPRDARGIEELIAPFASMPGSLIFFERKDRLKSSLAIIFPLLGPREVAVCRELTKPYEEFILTRLEEHATLPDDLRGEITVIIGPGETAKRCDEAQARAALARALDLGLKPRQAVREAQSSSPGWSSGELYALLLRLKPSAG